MRLEPVDAEIHAKAADVQRLDAEHPGDRGERARTEERCRARPAAIRRRSLGLDQPHRLAGDLGQRLVPRPGNEPGPLR